MSNKIYSIEGHLQRLVVFWVSVVLFAAYALLTYVILHWLSNQYDSVLLTKARTLVTLTKQKNTKIELDFADEFMPEFESRGNPEYFQIWVGKDTLLERSRSLASRNLTRHGQRAVGHRFDNVNLPDGRVGRQVEIVFLPQIVDKTQRTPENLAKQEFAVAVVAREREQLDQMNFTIQISLLIGMALMALMVAAIVRYAVRRGLWPLHQVRKQLLEVENAKLNYRLNIASPPSELKPVVKQFNELLDKLEVLLERERRFSADVAHELRTPVAEMRSLAEVAIRWPEDTKLSQGFFRDVLDASAQMQQLTNNLLALARCDSGSIKLELARVDLVDIVNATWLRVAKEAAEKRLSFAIHACEPFYIYTSRYEFELILNNIFSNAVAHSHPEGLIQATLLTEGNLAKFVLTNPTNELTVNDLQHVFSRLWRKEQSRSDGYHAGLGLSLVKAYANMLDLSVEVDLERTGEKNAIFKISVMGITRLT